MSLTEAKIKTTKPSKKATKLFDGGGYKSRMTGHGFRGLASTVLHKTDLFESEHIDLQLAHMRRNKVSAAHNHARYLKQQRAQMMQRSADQVDEARNKRPSSGDFTIPI